MPNQSTDSAKHVTAHHSLWTGPLIMLTARSVLAVVCQALVAVLFYRGSADAWNEAGHWWRVYGTAIDAGCIILLAWLARREGIRLLSLGNYRRERWLRDALIGLGLGVPLLLAFAGPTLLIEALLYGGPAPVPGTGLPVSGLIYALVVWPVIWAYAEDTTYFGYSLPRIEALTGRRWVAVLVVSMFAAVQHIFMPLRLEWAWLVSHFLGHVLGSVLYCLLVQRWRRLLPAHVSHWAINVIGVVMVILGRAR